MERYGAQNEEGPWHNSYMRRHARVWNEVRVCCWKERRASSNGLGREALETRSR